MSRQSRIFIALAAILAAVCLYQRWRAPDPMLQHRLDGDAARIQELEREIAEDVLFMRAGDRRSSRIRERVEEISRAVRGFRVDMERSRPRFVVDHESRFGDLAVALSEYEQNASSVMVQLEFMLEKMARAPEVIAAVERDAPQLWADPQLTATVASFVRDLFVSASRSATSSSQWFEEDLDRLRDLRDAADEESAEALDRLVALCDAVARNARFVDVQLRQLESLPMGGVVEDLRRAAFEDFVQRQRSAERWTWLLLAALAAGLAVSGFKILVFGKSAQLDQTEADLLKTQLKSKDEFTEELELRLEDERVRAERAEATYRRSRLQEQAAIRVRHEFLAFIDTHVRGRAESLLCAVRSDEPSENVLVTSEQYAQDIKDTLGDLFDMEAVRTQSFEVHRQACCLGEILQRASDHARASARAKAVTLGVERSPGLANEIYTDPERLRRVLQNLLELALISTETGGVELAVESSGNDSLQFTVRDTGRGMNRDRIDFLFTLPEDGERIEERVEAMSTPGLSVAPVIIERLGGAFHVDSVMGRGTTVAFTVDVSGPQGDVRSTTVGSVPSCAGEEVREQDSQKGGDPAVPLESTAAEPIGALEHAAPKTVGVTRSTSSKKPKEQPMAGRRVLVAEDGADNRRLMEYLLGNAGARLDMVENGKLALDAALEADANGQPYDIVLMDMNMPVMDGYQATEALRNEGYKLPIVALTASAMPENRARCLAAGCDEFLTKPVDAKTFPKELASIALSRFGEARYLDVEPERPVESTSVNVEHGPADEDASVDEVLISEYADDEDMGELIELFVQDLRDDMRKIQVALTDGDLECLGVLAHQLKGSAGSYGFPRLTEQADRLESCVRSGVDPDRLEQEVTDFVKLCERVRVS